MSLRVIKSEKIYSFNVEEYYKMQNYAHKDLYNKAINITEHNTNSRSSKEIYLSPSSCTPDGIPHHQNLIGSEAKAGPLQIGWSCWNDLAHIVCCTLKKEPSL